jgi:hypothetical protein
MAKQRSHTVPTLTLRINDETGAPIEEYMSLKVRRTCFYCLKPIAGVIHLMSEGHASHPVCNLYYRSLMSPRYANNFQAALYIWINALVNAGIIAPKELN